MKTACPHCQRTQKFPEELIGVSVTCSKCGQPFPLQSDVVLEDEPPDQLDAVDDWESGAEFDADHEIGDPPIDTSRLARSLRTLAISWCCCMVSTFVLLVCLAAIRVSDEAAGFFRQNSALLWLAVGATLLFGIFFVWGQFGCLRSHAKGSVARTTIGRSLRSWAFASAFRISGALAGQPLLKTVGSICGATALERFLAYLSIVAVQSSQLSIAMRVIALRKLFYRTIWCLIGLLLMFAFDLVPRPADFAFFLLIVLGFIITYTIFGVRLAGILFALARAAKH